MAYRILAVLALMLAVPASAQPPADAFCVILFEASPDFSAVTVTVDEETVLEERAALWPGVDRNGDGHITPAEKEAWKWNQTRAWADLDELGQKAITIHQDAPYTTWPEQQPVYAVTWRQVGHVFHQRDHELPDTLTETADLETQEVRTFGFDVSGEPTRIVLRGGRDVPDNLTESPVPDHQGRPVIEYVVVRAPPGWIVEQVEGRSYNGTIVETPGTRSVDLPAFDTQAPYAITFFHPARHEEQTTLGGGGIPGLEAGLLALVLIGACLLRRR